MIIYSHHISVMGFMQFINIIMHVMILKKQSVKVIEHCYYKRLHMKLAGHSMKK